MNTLSEALKDNALANAVGRRLVDELLLRRSFHNPGRYRLAGGDKTYLGVARTVARIFEESIPQEAQQ